MDVQKMEYKKYENEIKKIVFYFVLWNGFNEFPVNSIRPW